MSGRYERSVLRNLARQYDGTHKWRRTLAFGVVALVASLMLAASGMDRTPGPLAAFLGGMGVFISLYVILTAMSGPVIAPYVDTDRILRDLDTGQPVPESRA